jgi:hypothetical protein
MTSVCVMLCCAGTMPAVQSSPDLLPAASTHHQHSQQLQQQPEAVSPSGASLAKIRSLPAHYHSLQQAQLASEGGMGSTSHSPVLTSTHMGSAAALGGSVHMGTPAASAGGAQGATGAGAAASMGQQQQQVHGGPGVAGVLQQQLLRAAGRVGVVHLALHATDAGLVAGWQQQLAAVIEPGEPGGEGTWFAGRCLRFSTSTPCVWGVLLERSVWKHITSSPGVLPSNALGCLTCTDGGDLTK